MSGSLVARARASGIVLAVLAGGAVAVSGPPSATAAVPADRAFAVADGIVFPGPVPGAATGSVSGTSFTLGNAALATTWSVGTSVSLTSFTNSAGTATPVTVAGLFTLTLADGGTITTANSTRTAGPTLSTVAADASSARLAERSAGRAVTTTYRYTAGTRTLEVDWTALLRDGANTLQHKFAVRSVAGTFDITSLRLIDLTAANARVLGQDDGSPVVLGAAGAESAFLGVENPTAKATVAGTSVRIAVTRAGDLTQGTTWRYSAALGVAPDGQLRRSFQYYVNRERAHARRTFLHYQSWLDLKPPGENVDSTELTTAIDLFGTELTNRGAKIDSFWVDDGWDYVRAPQVADESNLRVWDFDPTEFPNGFAAQKAAAARYGNASMSVWMSPFGGYGQSASSRLALNASKPAGERLETANGAFQLGGTKYGARFRDVAFDMMDNQGVRGFKFDGIGGGLYQSGPNAQYLADYEALLTLVGDLRAHQKDIWVNATVGTWGSPYWLWYVDSIWRDGHDASTAGAGSTSQRYVNYRDSETYKNEVLQNPLFPVPSVMNHGVIFSDSGTYFTADYDLTKQSTRDEVGQDLKAYFALGLGLQELYVRNTLVRPNVPGASWWWDTLAANARWARANEALLSDVHWLGGDAVQGQVYGTAAWTSAAGASKGTMMLRNPSASPQTYTVNPRTVFELPTGVHGTYKFTERDGTHPGFVAATATPVTVTLAPFEVAVFQAVPTDEAPTGGDSPVLPRTGWTATTDSAETTSENGAAARAIDGNPATIWHTAYGTGVSPMPHRLDLDLGAAHTVDKLTYLPRQDGGTNGNVAGYEVSVSNDGTTWGTPVATGTFGAGPGVKTVTFPPVTARHVRLRATSAQNGLGYAAAAEVNLYGRPYASTALLKSGWTATADSAETSAENGAAARAVDGSASTLWHTAYSGGVAPMPHTLDIRMEATHTVDRLDYLPRQDGGTNGTIANYQIFVSADGTTWGTAIASGTFGAGAGSRTVTFPPVTARYVRLKATSAQNGLGYASAAEVTLYGI
ncbi:discoidin domain-containing protein [Longispora sp. NPDC051575]|uniref:discoidin domain-containing protein n=1 Tax=Longispora sp. NPDC051575 TaxID=3154943 RepID=UPI0034126CA3